MTEGHNNPPGEAEQFRFQIDTLKERVKAVEHVDDSNAGAVNDLIRLSGELAKDIDQTRAGLKKPHLDAGRDIDGTFNPLKTEAQSLPARIKALLSAHLRKKEIAAQEKAAEAARIAEEARQKAEADRLLVMPEDEAEVMQAAEIAEVEAVAAVAELKSAATAKGSSGLMASGLKTKRVPEITDAFLLVKHFKNHPDVIDAAFRLAKGQIRAARGGDIDIPGVSINEVREI